MLSKLKGPLGRIDGRAKRPILRNRWLARVSLSGPTAFGIVILLIAMVSLLPTITNAAEPPIKPIREIFVPFDDLNVLLRGDTERAFLTRDEYDYRAQTTHAQTISSSLPLVRLA